jgi:hypothetical protein
MLPIYAISIFVSALLLFTVQPLVGRLLLPILGGSPAVWNTCMVFFQAALLVGYLYAHALTKLRSTRAQVAVHVVLLLASAIALPIALPVAAVDPPVNASPVWWLSGMLALTCGAPFLMLSASAPLLQSWFSATDHRTAKDPYFLYAASNAGSMASLLAYPFLIERHLGLTRQADAWTISFAIFIVLALLCGIYSIKRARPVHSTPSSARGAAPKSANDDHRPSADRVTWGRRLWWLTLAAVPSSLLVGCTQFLTTDVAAFPLFWVIPLAIYLLTFIIAFSPRTPARLGWCALVLPIGVGVMYYYITQISINFSVTMGFLLHGSMLGAGALACHLKLARLRPPTSHLTEYFVVMSLGGVVGGAFNSLAAPVLFNDIYEYPIALGVAWWVGMPSTNAASALAVARSRLRASAPIAFRVLVGAVILWLLLSYQASRGMIQGYMVVHKERSFFGVLRVLVNQSTGRLRHLMHGTTNHGSQFVNPQGVSIPSTYYHPEGPFGEIMHMRFFEPSFRRVAIVGLGVGATASYGQGPLKLPDGTIRPRQQFHYYEIDPAVERVAKDDRFFTFLKGSKAELGFAIGDARLMLTRSTEAPYDLILIDAFSSDAIPIHLITKEAAELYLSKLNPDGILLFHVTNRHLDLAEPLARIAHELGVHSFARALNLTDVSEDVRREGIATSTWVVFVRDPAIMAPLAARNRQVTHERPWIPYSVQTGRLWTDEYADVLSVLRW